MAKNIRKKEREYVIEWMNEWMIDRESILTSTILDRTIRFGKKKKRGIKEVSNEQNWLVHPAWFSWGGKGKEGKKRKETPRFQILSLAKARIRWFGCSFLEEPVDYLVYYIQFPFPWSRWKQLQRQPQQQLFFVSHLLLHRYRQPCAPRFLSALQFPTSDRPSNLLSCFLSPSPCRLSSPWCRYPVCCGAYDGTRVSSCVFVSVDEARRVAECGLSWCFFGSVDATFGLDVGANNYLYTIFAGGNARARRVGRSCESILLSWLL